MPKSRTIACLVSSLLFVACAAPLPVTSARPANGEYVVLLHGLARTSGSMAELQERLMEKGYGTCNVNYPSRAHSIEDLVERYVRPQIDKCIPGSARGVHFVTHSMGGIVVRLLLRDHPMPKLGHVVMLSPPNQGSEVVDELGALWLFDAVNGPAGQQLGTGSESLPNRLGPATFSLGIITGNRSINPILSGLIPGPDDGKVSVERAKLEGMADFLVVPASHPFLMGNDKVIEQVLHFLREGAFRRE